MSRICLVVDDDANVRVYVRSILARREFDALEANDGVQALQLAQELDVALDLIVTDVEMPGGDGLTFFRLLRTSHPTMPVVFISGSPQFDSSDRPGDFCEFVPKPFSPRMLLEAIDRVVATSRKTESQSG